MRCVATPGRQPCKASGDRIAVKTPFPRQLMDCNPALQSICWLVAGSGEPATTAPSRLGPAGTALPAPLAQEQVENQRIHGAEPVPVTEARQPGGRGQRICDNAVLIVVQAEDVAQFVSE